MEVTKAALWGIVGISIVKNEADIIEPMIRHNLRYLDSILVIDNRSSDQTLAILLALRDEFPDRLAVRLDTRMGYPQKQIMNALAVELAMHEDINCLVPLDADELIRADRAMFRQTLLEATGPVHMPWINYIPTPTDDPFEKNPIRRMVHRLRTEPRQRFKTTFPIGLVGRAELSAGNHRLRRVDQPKKGLRKIFSRKQKLDLTSQVVEGLSIAHYPVRSKEQLFAKVVIGALNMRLRTGGTTREGFQWHELAQKIVDQRGMSDDEFYDAAKHYVSEPPVELIEDPLELHEADLPMHFPTDDQSLLIMKLVGFAQECVDAFGPTPDNGKQKRETPAT